jgi:hypothetical protein
MQAAVETEISHFSQNPERDARPPFDVWTVLISQHVHQCVSLSVSETGPSFSLPTLSSPDRSQPSGRSRRPFPTGDGCGVKLSFRRRLPPRPLGDVDYSAAPLNGRLDYGRCDEFVHDAGLTTATGESDARLNDPYTGAWRMVGAGGGGVEAMAGSVVGL